MSSGTTYTDAGVAPGTYRYVVVAADAAGNASPASSEEPATVAARHHRADASRSPRPRPAPRCPAR